MADIQRKWHKIKSLNFIKVTGVILLLFLLASYPNYKIEWAKKQATILCEQAVIGTSVDGLESKARELGLRFSRFEGNDEYPPQITAWEGWIFARYFCDIDYVDGKVTAKKVVFLD